MGAHWKPAPKRFEIAGVAVDLARLYVDLDVTPEQANAVGRMNVGDALMVAGGLLLRRVA